MKTKGFMLSFMAAMMLWGLVPAGAYVINDQY
jgi:hypothetical protein